MKHLIVSIVVSGVFLAAGAAHGQSPFGDMAGPSPSLFENVASDRPKVSLARVIFNIPAEARWAHKQATPACVSDGTETWGRDIKPPEVKLLTPYFRKGLEGSGAELVDPSQDLFESARSSADYAIGGVITKIDAHFCYPARLNMLASVATFGWASLAQMAITGTNEKRVKGDAQVTVEWQIYSPLERRVIARATTTGRSAIDRTSDKGGEFDIVFTAFGDASRLLVQTPEFQRAVQTRTAASVLKPQALPPLVFRAGNGGRKISEASRAVVLVITGSGHGSGVLVSKDGLILTNDHVVGDSRFVKIRWSDGRESLGEVIRSDRRRDVSVIKADAQGREPLGLKTTPPSAGDSVFAVGAPLDVQFQGSVTRGIVSANRTYEGLPYIQSDVTVNPGSSGGPLLDESGAVVGLTDLGYQPEGLPTNINLFIPIADALTYLALTPQ